MSGHKKVIHELSDDELLALAKGAKVEDILEKVSEAGQFIYDKKVREGRTEISAQLVYYTYKEYKGPDTRRQGQAKFFKDFNKYFTPYRTKNGMHYMLDARSFDTSIETYFQMRADLRNAKKFKKTKT